MFLGWSGRVDAEDRCCVRVGEWPHPARAREPVVLDNRMEACREMANLWHQAKPPVGGLVKKAALYFTCAADCACVPEVGHVDCCRHR